MVGKLINVLAITFFGMLYVVFYVLHLSIFFSCTNTQLFLDFYVLRSSEVMICFASLEISLRLNEFLLRFYYL